jgi:hypothetical protein
MSPWKSTSKKNKKRPGKAGSPRASAALPDLSEVFLEFAQPLLAVVAEPRKLALVQAALNLALLTWNLPMLERMGQAADIRALYVERMARQPEAKILVDLMMTMRLARWGHDPRIVARVDVQGDASELQIFVVEYTSGDRIG